MSMDSSGAAARTGTDRTLIPFLISKYRRRLDDRKAEASACRTTRMRWTLAAWPQSAHFFPLRVCGRRRSHGAPEAAARGPSSTPPIRWLASSLIRGCYPGTVRACRSRVYVARNRAIGWSIPTSALRRVNWTSVVAARPPARPGSASTPPRASAPPARRTLRRAPATRQVRHDHQRQVRRDLGLERDGAAEVLAQRAGEAGAVHGMRPYRAAAAGSRTSAIAASNCARLTGLRRKRSPAWTARR